MRTSSRETMQALVQAFLKDDLTVKEVIAYASAIVAIIFGGVLLWQPPAAIGTPGNVAIAFSFITGGFATFGVTIAIPTANRNGFALGYAAGVQGATFSGTGSLDGAHDSKGHGYVEITQLQAGEARQLARALQPFMAKNGGSVPTLSNGRHARLDNVSIMADQTGSNQTPLPDGDRVIVECTALDDNFASPQAHQTLEKLATEWVPSVSNKGTRAHFCCVSDM